MSVAELQGQLIGGERVGALDGERFEVLDPEKGIAGFLAYSKIKNICVKVDPA